MTNVLPSNCCLPIQYHNIIRFVEAAGENIGVNIDTSKTFMRLNLISKRISTM